MFRFGAGLQFIASEFLFIFLFLHSPLLMAMVISVTIITRWELCRHIAQLIEAWAVMLFIFRAGLKLFTMGKGDDLSGWKVQNLLINIHERPFSEQFNVRAHQLIASFLTTYRGV